jgi:uncharacterized protein
MIRLNIHGHHFLLLKEKAMFWEERRTLLISDVHLGKIMHFRREGIAVPDMALMQNFARLEDLLFLTNADRVVFLGDLFHNTFNAEWHLFSGWRKQFSQVEMIVVKGNHDILPDELFTNLDISIWEEQLAEESFLFTHHPLAHTEHPYFVFSGHIHPVFRMEAKARQSLRLPCFVLDPQQAILPGFGVFTGGHAEAQQPGRKIFVIGGEMVFPVGGS